MYLVVSVCFEARATMIDESIPPLRNAPRGTSAIKRLLTEASSKIYNIFCASS